MPAWSPSSAIAPTAKHQRLRGTTKAQMATSTRAPNSGSATSTQTHRLDRATARASHVSRLRYARMGPVQAAGRHLASSTRHAQLHRHRHHHLAPRPRHRSALPHYPMVTVATTRARRAMMAPAATAAHARHHRPQHAPAALTALIAAHAT